MATTGLPPDTAADVARVTEALAMITPRWNVRIMLALSGPPLRYSQIADKMPWLQNGQLHPKLRALCDAGLVQRTEHTSRHVTYGHTDRGAALLPVLPLVVTWAEEHLEKTDRPLPAIEQIEDSLTLLTRRHATAILWVLKSREEVSGRALARIVMPSSDGTNVYPPLRQLVADGLVDTDGTGQPYRLSEAGKSLAPVFGALSAWSAGQPLAQAAQHPVWGRANAVTVPTRWVSNQARLPAPAAPVRAGKTTWQGRDLFSHATTAHPKTDLAAGGPRR
ncbi:MULTISPECIES: winged helix-turn-helix transcriptional regulator [Streptomyces]|uniref:MarR family transcriptional regulator n=2 Tax=Streptomyces rimosus subsp. rimosus TaxID=132474 RepID=L8F0K6_STRR1|nr:MULTISPECIES: winged helix-turn-helix transcriptional regulator [Streptomyces]KOG67255.1 MarR family transcriptional regulator [Kitasatospora aureofaciens]MYT41854.1 MarR family transcriptional regulator [Streptomyces sp. SID5471]KOT25885.1 MarR family transcriptional regulator [Streptomyces rimosus subsp. rimosus]KOT25936.1 MarR family transcriptional regulator [Streptomyces sp. NRRL WC-3701]KOT66992.1 MarR family transcriptional regulator [Streptomyces rimosus subsp. rimosus]